MSLPERWLVLRVRCVGSDSDAESATALVAQALTDVGGRAVQEEEDGWCVTHLPAPTAEDPRSADDGSSAATSDPPSTADTDDPHLWRTRIADALGWDPSTLELRTGWQEHGDWAHLWRAGLAPRRVTERLVVTPSWCAPDERAGDLVITVDPGMAFGNAEHGTTRGCLRLLDECVSPGERILDVGAGSAILSIAAALFGADHVRAVEMDELAVPTARENVTANGMDGRVTVELARLDAEAIAALGPHDGVVANIEAGHLKPLVPGLVAATRRGGWLLLSGILDGEEAEMRRLAEERGATWRRTDADGEWRSLLFVRDLRRD